MLDKVLAKAQSPCVLIPAAFFLVMSHYLFSKKISVLEKPAHLIVPLVLVVLLVPGMLLTIPPGSKGLLRSGQSSLTAVLVHTVVFVLVYSFLQVKFPKAY